MPLLSISLQTRVPLTRFIPVHVFVCLRISLDPSLSCNDTRLHARERASSRVFFYFFSVLLPFSLFFPCFFVFPTAKRHLWRLRSRAFLASCFSRSRRNNSTRAGNFEGRIRSETEVVVLKTRLLNGDGRHETFIGLQRYYAFGWLQTLVAAAGLGQSHIHMFSTKHRPFFFFFPLFNHLLLFKIVLNRAPFSDCEDAADQSKKKKSCLFFYLLSCLDALLLPSFLLLLRVYIFFFFNPRHRIFIIGIFVILLLRFLPRLTCTSTLTFHSFVCVPLVFFPLSFSF